MHDFVIVGSGASGGRLADTLTAGGASVLLLEAGKHFTRDTFPRTEWDGSTRLFWNGGLEVTRDGRLGLLRGKCVGGTTIVNQALLDRFDEDAFQDWRDRSGIDFFQLSKFSQYYDAVEKGLSIRTLTESEWGMNAKIFTKACDEKRIGWSHLKRAQTDCGTEQGNDCISCLNGCHRDSKQSTLVTCIRRASATGRLEIQSEWEAIGIGESADSVTVHGIYQGNHTHVKAKNAFLAGGALGNVKVLSGSSLKEKLPALGSAFSCHPQFMSYGIFREPVDAYKGAFQTVKSQDPALRKRGYKLENVFAPPIGTSMLMPGFGKSHQRLMSNYRHLASMEVCTRDEPLGKITVQKSGKIVIDKPLSGLDRKKIEEGLELILQLFEAAGAEKVVKCEQGFGLHLMGGCVMGVNPEKSVVGPDFFVHGSKRIRAADSSVFPSAPGINPSLTVMALSHRAATEALKS